ncbi:MAG: P-loop NTPase [Rhodospirillales bacterium]
MPARPASKPASGKAKPLACFITDEVTVAAAKQAVGELGADGALVVQGGIAEAHKRLSKMATPNVLLVDLSGTGDPVDGLASLADVCDEGTVVLTIGDVNDIAVYRNLIGLGIRDYLVKPISTDDLKAAIARALNGDVDPKAANLGRLIGVVGAHGGVGATSVAVNIAWLIAQEMKRKVALVDLDIFFGTCGLALDLDVGRGFREALENPSRIDGLFIERAMAREGDNLFVLSTEEPLDHYATLDPGAVELLVEHLRHDFPYVVVDLPRFAARTQLFMLAPPSSLVVVSDPTLAGMRDTSRLVELGKKSAANTDLSVVLNRVGVSKAGELSRADFEKGCECKVAMSIPFDPAPFAAAAGAGKAAAATAGRAKAIKALRELTQVVAGQVRKDDRASVLSRFLKR